MRLIRAPWWSQILLINAFFIGVTGIFPYIRHDFWRWIVLNHFNLAGEMTIAAWWSTAMLLLAAWLAFLQASLDENPRRSWYILAVLFALLSLDELGSLHERATQTSTGTAILALSGAVGVLASAYALWRLWGQGHRQTVYFLFAGMSLMASAALHEYFEHRVNWSSALVGMRVAFEEGSEVTGMLLCQIGLVRANPGIRLRKLPQSVLAGLSTMPRIVTILGVGLILHLLLSLWVTKYVVLDFRGNPGVWYFSAIFFYLSVTYLWLGWYISEAGKRYLLFVLVAYFLALSIGGVYFITPRFNSLFLRMGILSDLSILLGAQLPLIAVARYLLREQLPQSPYPALGVLGLIFGVIWTQTGAFPGYLAADCFAFTAALLFRPVWLSHSITQAERVPLPGVDFP